LSDSDNEAYIVASIIYIFLEKMLKFFVMLINIATLILKGRSQKGERKPGPLPSQMLPRTAKN